MVWGLEYGNRLNNSISCVEVHECIESYGQLGLPHEQNVDG